MQHLNLYDQLDKYVEPAFSARQQLRAVFAVSAVMILVAITLWLGQIGLQSELESLQQEQQAVAAELERQKAEKARLENDPELDREIERLKRNVEFRQRLLANIAPEGKMLEKGFADHLSGLARQTMDGLWFTEIQLQSGGQEMALLGRTRDPAFLPKYLQKLSGENVFAGHNFRVFRMNVPTERKDLLDFELRAREVGVTE